MNKDYIFPPHILAELCQNFDWCDGATEYQKTKKITYINKQPLAFNLRDLSIAIWSCSQKATLSDITSVLSREYCRLYGVGYDEVFAGTTIFKVVTKVESVANEEKSRWQKGQPKKIKGGKKY